MISLNRAYTIENGLSFDDNVGIFAGSGNPEIEDDGVPEGSIYIQFNNGTSNKLWQKTGSLTSNWTEITTGTSGLDVDDILINQFSETLVNESGNVLTRS